MADVTVVVKSIDQGSQGIQRFGAGLEGMAGKALKVGASLGAVGLALAGVERAGRMAWQTLGEGAALELAQGRFENLAGSIDTTADALMSRMGEASRGMMTNAQMVASASDIISLGLGDSSEEVVRLSNLVGQLGWDMQVLTLTMANDSTMRLDSLGLSVENVTARMDELKAAGMASGEAFDLAVIEAGEEKLELLGSAAETSAGKMQRAQNAVTDYTDALKMQAVQLADNIGLFAVLESAAEGTSLRNQLVDMRNAGQLTTEQYQELFATLRYGGPEAAEKLLESMGKLKIGLEGVDNSLLSNTEAWEGYYLGLQIAATEAENGVTSTRRSGAALSEWTDEAKEAALAAGELAGEFAGIDLASVAGATQSGIWRAAGAHIQSILDEAAEAAEAEHREAAEAIAQAYEEAATRMSSAFSAALQDGGGFDFGDTDAMSEAAWGMAQAFGLTVQQAGDLGIAMGEITPEMAEAATKAVLFQEAFGNLLGQLGAGNLDTEGFMAAYDALIADMETKSLIEIQVELKQVENPARELWAWLPKEERQAIEIPVEFTPEQAALNSALDMIDGIPDDQAKLITFDATYETVTTAITTIESDIAAMVTDVAFEPDVAVVNDEIERIDQSRLTVYVDFVTGTPPTPPGNAVGGPVSRGKPTIVGEAGPELFVPWTHGTIVPNHEMGGGGGGLTVYNYFYGPTDANAVSEATQTAGERLLERIRQAGVTA